MKSPELEIRPVHHRLEHRVRAHVFLSMLAYAVRFEIEQRLAPLLFKDDAPLAPADPVAPAQRSPASRKKAASKRTEDGLPLSSFGDLALLKAENFRLVTRPAGRAFAGG